MIRSTAVNKIWAEMATAETALEVVGHAAGARCWRVRLSACAPRGVHLAYQLKAAWNRLDAVPFDGLSWAHDQLAELEAERGDVLDVVGVEPSAIGCVTVRTAAGQWVDAYPSGLIRVSYPDGTSFEVHVPGEATDQVPGETWIMCRPSDGR